MGLDLGTNSIGWAVVNEASSEGEKSSIVKLGVRTISYDNFVSSESGKESKEPVKDFSSGKGISCNAGRTAKRSARRNLQRYKLRRDFLRKLLKEKGFIDDSTILAERGNATTFETYRLRAKAATDEISLSEFARVLLMINKKRGYKSNRKAKSAEEGQAIDGMDIARTLYENQLTPGQFVLQRLRQGKTSVPDFYPSDLQAEFDKIWNFQAKFYPEEMSAALHDSLCGKNGKQTWAICKEPFHLVGIKRETKGAAQKLEDYEWRTSALSQKLDLENLAVVLQNINGQINASSGYLGAIGDRSKVLQINHLTVGQYQMAELEKNPNYSLKNQVFFRQDYLDEFERLWETQAEYHSELTPDLKKTFRDAIIFYQRPLRSQKNLVGICELEKRQVEVEKNGVKRKKWIGPKVCPKSMPLFQEFKIWQRLNDVLLTDKVTGECDLPLDQKQKEILFAELNLKEKLSKKDALKCLNLNIKDFDLNFETLEGNRTQARLLEAYRKILEESSIELDFSKMNAQSILAKLRESFAKIGASAEILDFDVNLPNPDFERQKSFRLWHLLYSFEGDKSVSGDERLVEKIEELCGFSKQNAKILAAVTFEDDYASLSAKSMRKILPYMKAGSAYSEACEKAGYRHSRRSLTREELEAKVYKDHLELLPKNSLRNPVVEKILNQMVNVVNAVVDSYGKPDEIRIELARELKKSAKERQAMTKSIADSTKQYEEFRKVLQKSPFNISNPTRNDLLRYKLYEELSKNGYKTLYSNQPIKKELLFSKEYDIEHIIPQAKRFDDSFANKTLELRSVNLQKSNRTAFDFVRDEYGEGSLEDFKKRIEFLKESCPTKYKNLLISERDGAGIPDGFIERDLRETQYIAKLAREMLEDLVKFVVPTTGSVTDRLRNDWQLVNVMQELNLDKYDRQGLTGIVTVKDESGQEKRVKKIQDWTKRNDHRHHAMDALTIAFTKRSYIQYLNHLNARVPKEDQEIIDLSEYDLSNVPANDLKKVVASIEAKELYRERGKLRFKPPMPLDEFRAEAKKQLESTLISIKAKNKVVTQSINTIKTKNGVKKQKTLTPRGQLHNESIYGKIRQIAEDLEPVNAKMTLEKIENVCDARYREALKARLSQFGGDPKLAFAGKNSLEKNPLWLDGAHTKKVPSKVQIYETIFTIRKKVAPDLNVEKVVDKKIKEILKRRLDEFGGKPEAAFANLEQNPIWQNKEKGIAIKSVVIRGASSVIALHGDHDFVMPNNNHHVAIYLDAEGNLQDQVVSFLEATERSMKGLPVIDKEFRKADGWKFLFTMKRNECFVFPNSETGFDPKQIDLTDPKNYAAISPNLFRVQGISKVEYGNQCVREYKFRHHLEALANNDNKALQGITWKKIKSLSHLNGIVKVRINSIGQIVSVGEY